MTLHYRHIVCVVVAGHADDNAIVLDFVTTPASLAPPPLPPSPPPLLLLATTVHSPQSDSEFSDRLSTDHLLHVRLQQCGHIRAPTQQAPRLPTAAAAIALLQNSLAQTHPPDRSPPSPTAHAHNCSSRCGKTDKHRLFFRMIQIAHARCGWLVLMPRWVVSSFLQRA